MLDFIKDYIVNVAEYFINHPFVLFSTLAFLILLILLLGRLKKRLDDYVFVESVRKEGPIIWEEDYINFFSISRKKLRYIEKKLDVSIEYHACGNCMKEITFKKKYD